MTRIDLAYRQTAAQGASGFGLLIALYDTLAGNLQRAAEAERANDLDRRGEEVRHALLVLAHLEDWVRRGPGGELADQLVAFYASVRRNMINAQLQRSAVLLEQQMTKVLQIRGYWQQADATATQPKPEVIPPMNGLEFAMSIQSEPRHSNWSA